jgi:hypothetical protein
MDYAEALKNSPKWIKMAWMEFQKLPFKEQQ